MVQIDHLTYDKYKASAQPYDPWRETEEDAIKRGVDFHKPVVIEGVFHGTLDGQYVNGTGKPLPVEMHWSEGSRPTSTSSAFTMMWSAQPGFLVASPADKFGAKAMIVHLFSASGIELVGAPSQATAIPEVPKGTRIRLIGLYQHLRLTDARVLQAAILDLAAAGQPPATRFTIQELVTPLEKKTPQKASLKERKEYGDILLQAAISGDWTTAREAIASGGLINTRVEADHTTALSRAVNDKKLKAEERRSLVRFLLEYGADPNADRRILPVAVAQKDADVVALLLRAGADPSATYALTGDAYSAAYKANEPEIIGLLELVRAHTGGGGLTEEAIAQIKARNYQLSATASRLSGAVAPSSSSEPMQSSSAKGHEILVEGKPTPANLSDLRVVQGVGQMLTGAGRLVLDSAITLELPGAGWSASLYDPDGRLSEAGETLALARFEEKAGKLSLPLVRSRPGGAWLPASARLPIQVTRSGATLTVTPSSPLSPGNYMIAVDTRAIVFRVH
jgi:hypothetical protein